MANKKKRDQDWVEAKRRCQLNQEDIRKAKELGLNPRKLIKNIPILTSCPTTIQCRLMSTSSSMTNQSRLMLTSWSTTIQSPSE